MGSISNGYAPFQINYVFHKNTILRPRTRNNERKTPYGPSVKSCDQEARPGLGTCSCTDCESACSVPDFPWKRNDTEVELNFPYYNDVDLWPIITISFFAIVLVAFFIASFFALRKSSKVNFSTKPTNPMTSSSDKQLQNGHANGNAFEIEDGKNHSSEDALKKDLKNFKLGSAINRLLEITFIRIGIFCAKHPIPVIIVDMIIIIALCCGLSLLRITTDPIELWAAPNSR